MKNYINKTILILLVNTTICICIQAQNDSIRTKAKQTLYVIANRYFNGINTSVNYAKAKQIYQALASENESPAMNHLGIMYLQGLGVAQNNDSARYYFEQGAALNNTKSLFNLGLLYKNGTGVTQDFAKSFDYFQRSLNNGGKGANYAVGYYYYKGLGVTQDYVKANEYFKTGADANIAACQYMLGVCYIKGYGVEQDTTMGKQLIAKAALKGYDKAIDFIKGGKLSEEISLTAMRSTRISSADTLIPNALTRQKRQQKDKIGKNNINGIWSGKLITYDWSGKTIEKEQNLQLVINSDGTSLSGSWTEADTVNIRIEGYLTDSVWTFTNSKYEKQNHRNWQINQGSFELVKDGTETYLKGSVTKYTLTTKEPSKPAYIVLQQTMVEKSAQSDSTNNLTSSASMFVYPNPFNKEITVKLTLAQTQSGSFQIVDLLGKVVYVSDEQNFEGGQTINKLVLNLNTGNYTLSFKGTKTNLKTKLIKK